MTEDLDGREGMGERQESKGPEQMGKPRTWSGVSAHLGDPGAGWRRQLDALSREVSLGVPMYR